MPTHQQISERGAISYRDVYLGKLSAELIKERIGNGLTLDASTLRSKLAEFRAELTSLSDTDLEIKVGDSDRVRHYKNAQWVSSEVELARCWVWPAMGGIAWASGRLSAVAEKFSLPTLFPLTDEKRVKLDSIAGDLAVISNRLPIIVFVQDGARCPGLHPSYDGKRGDGEFDIDDGCHRAIAAWQAGHRMLPAFVGYLPRAFR
jgi:hypothetical protein